VAEINVAALAMVDADPERVRASIADYREFRRAILTPHFSAYEVLEGGQGAGSRVRWTLNPGKWTRRRAREWEVTVEEVDGALVEHDAHSSAVMTWTVVSAPDGRSAVKLALSFTAPGGLGGMRARSRTNKLHHLYGETLLELRKQFLNETEDGVKKAAQEEPPAEEAPDPIGSSDSTPGVDQS
jgi:hypothetical protein